MAKHLMAGLPALGDRVQEIRSGKAATSSQENEWNFARSQVSVGWGSLCIAA